MRERSMNRRRLLSGVAAAGVGAALPMIPAPSAAQGKAVVNGRIRQSVVFWCFNAMGDRWDLERVCRVARDLGCQSVEIVPPDQWKVLRKYNLTCAIAPNGMPGAPFMRGFNNPRYHEEVIDRTRKAIDACAEANVPTVIAFTCYSCPHATHPKTAARSTHYR